MLRFIAGAAASFLLLIGAFLIRELRAEERPGLPGAPAARTYSASMVGTASPLIAPEASARSREQQRFSRYDHDKDGKVEAAEYLGARRRNFDKLDADHNGALSFQEYAVKGIEKFTTADHGRKGWLSVAELATTAPPPPKRKACSCGQSYAAKASDSSDD